MISAYIVLMPNQLHPVDCHLREKPMLY